MSFITWWNRKSPSEVPVTPVVKDVATTSWAAGVMAAGVEIKKTPT